MMIVMGVRAMLHDENVYGPNALEFRPERFLDKELPFPEIAFGFGRRICPGLSFPSFLTELRWSFLTIPYDICR